MAVAKMHQSALAMKATLSDTGRKASNASDTRLVTYVQPAVWPQLLSPIHVSFFPTFIALFPKAVDLGEFGGFELEVSGDGSTMSWSTGLWNLQKLIPLEKSIGYHIHNEWSNPKSSIGVSGEECALGIAGNHYDPYFACGPASAARTLADGQPDFCYSLGRSPQDYICSPGVYNGGSTFGRLDQCEVGDLSGKYGSIPITNGEATDSIEDDPLPVLNPHYVNDTDPYRKSSFDEFASIVFHRGSDGSRFLCGQLKLLLAGVDY